jgi:hypothetical protein
MNIQSGDTKAINIMTAETNEGMIEEMTEGVMMMMTDTNKKENQENIMAGAMTK